MKILYCNVRSLYKKLDDLIAATDFYSPDIIFMCETWLNSNTSNAMLSIKGYQIISELRQDRVDTKHGAGGGLIVYAKSNLKISPIDINSDFIQAIAFSVDLNYENQQTNNIKIFGFYRSPNSSDENSDKLAELIKNFSDCDLLIGDLNLPRISWENHKSDSKGQQILDTVDSNGLTQLIDFTTHNKGGILDVAFAPTIHNVNNIQNIGNIGSSDHTAIVIDFAVNLATTENVRMVRNWRHGDVDGFRTYLMENAMRNVLADEDPWATFHRFIEVGLDSFVPKIACQNRNKPPWLNREAKNACNNKRRHFRNFLKSKSPADLTKYKQSEKRCKKVILKSKKAFERRIANESDKRAFSYYVKSKNKNKETIGPLKVDNRLINDPKSMCQVLNNYFISVFSKDMNVSPIVLPDANNGHIVNNCHITPQVVAKYIDKLKCTTSKDPNGYSNRFLKDFKNELKGPLAKIFNNSLNTGKVPNDWKNANVMPIFKKGQKSSPANYRPVSLTSVVCKLFERIIQSKIVEHLETNKLLKKSQHGFPRKTFMYYKFVRISRIYYI